MLECGVIHLGRHGGGNPVMPALLLSKEFLWQRHAAGAVVYVSNGKVINAIQA